MPMDIISRIRALIARTRARPITHTRILLRRATDLKDGDPPWWLRFQSRAAGTLAERTPKPLVRCPKGHCFAIVGGHSVDGTSGEVNPRVGCPKCGWAALVTLTEWDPS